MAEAFYKIGDILELDGNASFPRQFGMFPKDTKIRCMVLKCIKPGYEFIIYTLLVHKIDGSFDTVGINQKDIAIAAKRVGHIDISSFLSDEESSEPDYAMFFTAATIAQAADLRNELDKVKKENKMLKNENEVLKRENEELRSNNKELEQALSKSEEKAHSRLDEIAFLMRKVDELENTNKKQKAKCDEASHEISRLRTVIGGLNDVIDDLNTSKSEISDLFCSLKNALQTNDILEGVNKLKKENERLRNENKNLKAMNDELGSSWIECCTSCKQTEENKKLMDENAKLQADNEKLRAVNVSFSQKIKCAEKYFDSAAAALYEGREHLSIAQNDISNK